MTVKCQTLGVCGIHDPSQTGHSCL
jgi:hypothetical protein